MGKINASDKIVLKTRKKEIWKLKAPSEILFRHTIYSLLRWADARGSADIIYHIWCISL